VAVAVKDEAVGAVAQAAEDGGVEEVISRSINVLYKASRVGHTATPPPVGFDTAAE
jgi:hypothetical protein